jgi:5-methylcytosine-specific restriction endonuclease McrA
MKAALVTVGTLSCSRNLQNQRLLNDSSTTARETAMECSEKNCFGNDWFRVLIVRCLDECTDPNQLSRLVGSYNLHSRWTNFQMPLLTVARCVHCLTLTDDLTADHVFPNSWYPDATADTVQRWTVPSCGDCNRKLGELERDLVIRMALCVDPKSQSASGLAAKALRSLGLDVEGPCRH